VSPCLSQWYNLWQKIYGFLLNGLFVVKACLLVKKIDLGERKVFFWRWDQVKFEYLWTDGILYLLVHRCVLRGCVPKKLLVYASSFSHDFDSSQGFGWSYDTEPVHDWKTLISNKNVELKRLTGVYKSLLQKSNVTLLEGRGKVQILTPLCWHPP